LEAILNFFGEALIGAVIVMDLNDEPVLLTFGRGAVSGAGAYPEVGQGIEHCGHVVAVDVKAKLHSLTGAFVSINSSASAVAVKFTRVASRSVRASFVMLSGIGDLIAMIELPTNKN
jgi:hypothetical protein